MVSIHRLARDFVFKYGDHWLTDLLSNGSAPSLKVAIRHLGRAISANQSGEPDEALSEARRAEQLFRRLNSAGVLRARFEEIYALHRQGNGKRCLELARPLKKLLLQKNYPWLQVQVVFEASICQALSGNFGTSLGDIRNATVQAGNVGLDALALRGLGLDAELEATAGNQEAAWKITQAGFKKLSSGPFTPMRAYQFYAGLAFSAEARKDWNVAVALNKEANRFVDLTDNGSIEAMAHYRLAGDYLMAGDRVRASQEFKISNALFAQLPQSDSWKAYRAYGELILAGLETQRTQFAPSRELLENSEKQLSRLTDNVIQLTYFKIRGNLELKSNNFAAAKQAYLSALDLGRAWLASVKDNQDRLAWNGEMADVYRGLTKIYALREHDPVDALAIWEEYRAIAVGLPLATQNGHRAAQNRLKSLLNETLLTYVQFEDGLGIWVADDRGVSFQWAPVPATATEKKTTEFRALCSDPNSDLEAIKLHARDLYAILVKPIETQLEQRRTLLLDADSSLTALPFPALRTLDDQYFIEKFTLISSPGLSFEWKVGHRHQMPFAAQHALIMAPSPPLSPERDLLPLPEAIEEATKVAEYFKNRKLLIGTDATVAAFERYISISNILHFAGHAIFNRDRIGLVMTTDGQKFGNASTLLSAESLKKVNLHDLRLVVLAACSTGGNRDPVSQSSLPGAFLESGVPSVIATGWDIDSATAKGTMERFYESLSLGRSVADSLRDSELMLLSTPKSAHPYYWAAFRAFGSS